MERLQEIANLIATLDADDPYEGSVIAQLIQEATDLQEELGIEFEFDFIINPQGVNL